MKNNSMDSISKMLNVSNGEQIVKQLYSIAKHLQIRNCIETAKLTKEQYKVFQVLIKEVVDDK